MTMQKFEAGQVVDMTLAEIAEIETLQAAMAPDPVEPYRIAVEAHVDDTARSRDYRSADSLAGYVASGVPQWQAEAQAFVAWRDAVWVQVFSTLGAVQAGEREAPTPEGLVGELPGIEWPSSGQ